MLKKLPVLLLLIISGWQASAQLISFPGAEGAGRFTSGGRGTPSSPTTVFFVTNLNDDNQPGSLRYAVQASTSTYPHRTIIFRVSGTIHLTSTLSIRGNTTIAGQTAPGDGICIADRQVSISGDNVIIRYVRFRVGDKYQQALNGPDDALSALERNNIMIDHCSFSWSNDEALTVYRGDSTTLQWNMISEPLNYSYHDEGSGIENHGYGGIWGSKKGSFHHNLFAHCQSRTPRFAGVSSYSPSTVGIENVDFRNNVIYNWGGNNVYGGEGGNYNLVNNYYKYGPSTNSSVRYRVVNPSKTATIPWGKYYLSGNYVDGSPTNTNNNWLGVTMGGGSLSDTSQVKMTTPFAIAPVTTQSAQDAYESVLLGAGASLRRDTLDQRIVNDVKNRTGRIIDVQGGYPHGTPYSQTVSAWPVLNSLPAPVDTDNDGMPDAWETANGLNPNNASDRAGIASNGYTNLENYLNSLVTTSIQANGTLNPFSQNIGTPSQVQTYSVSASSVAGALTITPPAGYEVSSNGGTNWFNASNPLVLSGSSISPTTISVRLNATGAGDHNGSIMHSSPGSASVFLPVKGRATALPAGVNAIVAADGSGNFTSIQAAINAAPSNSATAYIIFVKNGIYREKVVVPSNKTFIHLVGESAANTVLTWDDAASTPLPGGGTVGTFNSYTLYVNGADFMAMNMTFENSFGDGSQAVAVHVNADRAAFNNCRFLGNQDTLLTNGNAGLRQYFRNCYIDGNVDFIFGSARAVFDSCIIFPKARTNAGNSYITAANTQSGQPFGYVFRDSYIPAHGGNTMYYLARPWQNSSTSSPIAHNKTVFLNSVMSHIIRPEGWSTWDGGTNTSVIYYGEYKTKNVNGTFANVSQRVAWSYQLSDADAAGYTNAALFGSWDPCSVHPDFCSARQKEIALTNFKAEKGTSNSVITWNPSWAMTGVKYEVYRSLDSTGNFSKIFEQVAQNDTSYNFMVSDVLPPAGNSFFYFVKASKAGWETDYSDTVELSRIPVISTTGSLNSFAQNYGNPSPSQVITVAGANLVNGITIAPSENFEVSLNGTNWYDHTNPLIIPESNNTVSSINLSVRMNAAALGDYTGTLTLSSTGAASIVFNLTGNNSIIPPSNKTVIQAWPMAQDNQDDPSERSPGVVASAPTFSNFYLSNGTTAPAVPPYSVQRGQAFGPGANGEGLWTTATGGNGSSLSRVFYEEFTVTAANGYSVRIDSITMLSAFYNSSSGTKLAVVYSRSAFTTDSADVTHATGPSGVQPATQNGAFSSPVLLANQTSGPTNRYAFALEDNSGVLINAGETLTIRLYFSCGSTSPGRYAFLKNVQIVGEAINASAPVTLNVNGNLSPFNQTLGTPSNVQTYTVSGSNLSSDVLVLPPSGFELSADGGLNWSDHTTPLTLSQTSGTLAMTTISVRLNAVSVGTSSGDIIHVTAGTPDQELAVSGTTSAANGITTIASLQDFDQTAGTPSVHQTYTVSGSGLSGNIIITPPAEFEVSADGGTTWFTNTNPLTLTPSGGTIASTSVDVRLNASMAGTYSGNIVHTTSGYPSSDVAVNGETKPAPQVVVNASLSAFQQTGGSPSAIQTYTVSGSNLTGDITIVPGAPYEVSANGGQSWHNQSNPLVLTNMAGQVNSTTVSIRLTAASSGSYPAEVLHTSPGATTIAVAVTGTTTIQPQITLAANLQNFIQVSGSPSAVQSYTIGAADLSAPLVVTPPAGFEVSLNGTDWFGATQPLSIPQASANGSTIHVRLNASTTGNHSGSISHSSTGAQTQSLMVNGITSMPPTLVVVSELQNFIQQLGNPSPVQTIRISGESLSGSIQVKAPYKYQLSKDGLNWIDHSQALTYNPSGGRLVEQSLFVRLNAAFPGNYNGQITVSGGGAPTQTLNVEGQANFEGSFRAYPVPAKRKLFLTHTARTGQATISVFNSQGVIMKTYPVTPGTMETVIDLTAYPAGSYFAEYRAEDVRFIYMFMKQ